MTLNGGEYTALEKEDDATIQKLVLLSMQHDEKALLELCRVISKGNLFRTQCILRNHMDAEDVSQEVLVRVCRRVHTINDPKAFHAWISSIIMNEINRFMNQSFKQGVLLNIEDYSSNFVEEDGDCLPEEYVQKEEIRRKIMGIIGTLPEQQRKVIIMHYYDGLSVTETANAIGMAKSNVCRNLSLAREKIKRALEKDIFKAESMKGMGFVPFGALVTQVLKTEAMSFTTVSEVWLNKTMAKCNEAIVKSVPKGYSAARTTFLVVAGTIAATAAVALAAIIGPVFSETSKTPESTPPPMPISYAAAHCEVVYSGGIENGATYAYCNPLRAEARSADGSGFFAKRWWITPKGKDSVLFEGEGAVVTEAFKQLKKKSGRQEYILHFLIKDGSGKYYNMGRSFYIIPDKT